VATNDYLSSVYLVPKASYQERCITLPYRTNLRELFDPHACFVLWPLPQRFLIETDLPILGIVCSRNEIPLSCPEGVIAPYPLDPAVRITNPQGEFPTCIDE
jgi:hypothetical protein